MQSFLASLGTPDNIIPLIVSALRILFIIAAAIILMRLCNKGIKLLKGRLHSHWRCFWGQPQNWRRPHLRLASLARRPGNRTTAKR